MTEIETLRNDLHDIKTALPELGDPTKVWVSRTLLPFLESMVDQLSEIDESILDLVEQTEDILQPETAGVFAIVIQGCLATISHLGKRLKKTAEDAALAKELARLKTACIQARELLVQITVAPEEPEDPNAPEAPDEPDEPAPPADQPTNQPAEPTAPSPTEG